MAVFTSVPKWSTGASASKLAAMFNFFSISSRDAGVTIRSAFLMDVNLSAATTNWRHGKKGVTSAAEEGKLEPNVWEMFLAKNPAGANQPDGKA